MPPTQTHRRLAAGVATAVLALALSAGAAGAEMYGPIPQPVPPTVSTVSITPGKGLPGTAISVNLAFSPVDACPGWPAVALRTKPGYGNGSAIVSTDLSLSKQSDGSYLGTLQVPQTATPGTIYWADGGCIGDPNTSPPVPFLVVAPDIRAQPAASQR